MNNLPMIENEWEACEFVEYWKLSNKLTKSYQKEIHSPYGVLALALIESSFQAAVDGEISQKSFREATFYASYISGIPQDILCNFLTQILVARGSWSEDFPRSNPVDGYGG
jgi:hypothetical protein